MFTHIMQTTITNERPKIYIITRGEKHEGAEIIGNHLNKATACEYAERVINKMAKGLSLRIEHPRPMEWTLGCNVVAVEEHELNDLDMTRVEQ
jgi:hypothetical protein